MDDRSTHLAVIGAGPVGLAVAKAVLQHEILYEQALRQMKFAKYTLPLLRRKERKLRKRFKPVPTSVLFNNLPTSRPDPEVKIF